jgi:hypothetical protein
MWTLEELVNDGWSYHGLASERLACELEAVSENAARSSSPVRSPGRPYHRRTREGLARACALGWRILHGHEANKQTVPAWERLYVAGFCRPTASARRNWS